MDFFITKMGVIVFFLGGGCEDNELIDVKCWVVRFFKGWCWELLMLLSSSLLLLFEKKIWDLGMG